MGWRNDCVQLRLITDLPVHVDCWYSEAARRPVVNMAYGSYKPGPVNAANYVPILSPTEGGAKQAFLPAEDGKGYTQEIVLPWKLITGQNAIVKATGKPFADPRIFQAGDTLTLNMEFIWGGVDGRGSPSFRYIDMTREDCSNRSFHPFVWEKLPYREDDLWGTLKLEPQGRLNLPAPDYSAAGDAHLQKTAGPVKLTYTMPFDGFATLVIEDKQGRRVRNLIGMAPRANGGQTDRWDCTGEDGKLVPAGEYRFRGLLHKGIEPVYKATYGNPGNPPWETSDGTGGWLSDNSPPRAVAAAKGFILLGADEASEWGSSLICTDLNGRKQWGDRALKGIHSLAADDKTAYVSVYREKRNSWRDWNTNYQTWIDDAVPPTLARFDIRTGKPIPFVTKSGPQLRVPVLKQGEKPLGTAGIAATADRLAVSIPELNVVRFFDKETAAVIGDLPLPEPGNLAYDASGVLHVWSDNNVMKVADGKPAPLMVDPLKHPAAEASGAIAIDAAGRVFLADRAANQVKVYDKTGAFVRAIGVEGGRPLAGKWQANAMLNPVSVAVDSLGRVWVAEEDPWPRRVSVWSADGALVRDFIGPGTFNRATDANIAVDDETRVFGSGCEWKLDYNTGRAEVMTCFRKELNGKWLKAEGRDYLAADGSLFLRAGDDMKLVARVGTFIVSWQSEIASPDYGGIFDAKDGLPLPPWEPGKKGDGMTMSFIWTDANGDGRHQPEELLMRSPWTGCSPGWAYPVGCAGDWLDEDFTLYGHAFEGIHGLEGGPFLTQTPLKGWTPGGAPIWDTRSQRLLTQKKPWMIHLATDGMLIGTAMDEGLMTCLRSDDGAILWTCRNAWPNTHQSNLAPMPDRDDRLISPMSCIGKAGSRVGPLFAMNSKMGRLYLMTTDGLFVASVFQDFRGGVEPWPKEAKPGTPLIGMTMGDLWWGGHFFQGTKTKAYYLIAGSAAYDVIQLTGFDELKAIPGGAVAVSDEDLKTAAELLPRPADPAKPAAR